MINIIKTMPKLVNSMSKLVESSRGGKIDKLIKLAKCLTIDDDSTELDRVVCADGIHCNSTFSDGVVTAPTLAELLEYIKENNGKIISKNITCTNVRLQKGIIHTIFSCVVRWGRFHCVLVDKC